MEQQGLLTIRESRSGRNLIQDQPQGVDIYSQECLPLEIYSPLQDLRSHVPRGADLGREGRVGGRDGRWEGGREGGREGGKHGEENGRVKQCNGASITGG